MPPLKPKKTVIENQDVTTKSPLMKNVCKHPAALLRYTTRFFKGLVEPKMKMMLSVNQPLYLSFVGHKKKNVKNSAGHFFPCKRTEWELKLQKGHVSLFSSTNI